MPNHVTHRVEIAGPDADVTHFRETCIREIGDRVILDFNTIIPMPEILRDSQAGTREEMGAALIIYRADRGAPYADHAEIWSKRMREELGMTDRPISEVAAVYLEKNPEYEVAGRKRLTCILETGFADWYSWSTANWGTKWNSYQFQVVTEAPLEVTFDTAWSFPQPIFEKLVEMFPTLTFDVVCFDEGWNFAGKGLFGVGADVRPYSKVEPDDALYEAVYGHAPERDEDEEEG